MTTTDPGPPFREPIAPSPGGGTPAWTAVSAEDAADAAIATLVQEAGSAGFATDEGTVVGTLVGLVGQQIRVLHQAIDTAFRMSFVDTAEGAVLDAVVALVGVVRLPAQQADGQVTFNSSRKVTVPKGWIVRDARGVAYRTRASVDVTPGSPTTVAAHADQPGASGNAPATTVTVVKGISGLAVTAASRFAGGSDAERDGALRERAKLVASSTRSTLAEIASRAFGSGSAIGGVVAYDASDAVVAGDVHDVPGSSGLREAAPGAVTVVLVPVAGAAKPSPEDVIVYAKAARLAVDAVRPAGVHVEVGVFTGETRPTIHVGVVPVSSKDRSNLAGDIAQLIPKLIPTGLPTWSAVIDAVWQGVAAVTGVKATGVQTGGVATVLRVAVEQARSDYRIIARRQCVGFEEPPEGASQWALERPAITGVDVTVSVAAVLCGAPAGQDGWRHSVKDHAGADMGDDVKGWRVRMGVQRRKSVTTSDYGFGQIEHVLSDGDEPPEDAAIPIQARGRTYSLVDYPAVDPYAPKTSR